MGCVMGRGLRPPSRQLVRCLSAKAAARNDGGAGRPLVRMPPSGRRAGFAAWAADGRLGTFVVTPPEGAPSPRELLRLRLPEEQLDRKLAPQASQAHSRSSLLSTHLCCSCHRHALCHFSVPEILGSKALCALLPVSCLPILSALAIL